MSTFTHKPARESAPYRAFARERNLPPAPTRHTLGPPPADSHAAGSYAAGSHAAGSYAAGSYATDPDTTAPYAADPYTTAPYAADPYTTAPYAADPYTTAPYAADPYTTAPYAADPDATDPHTADPYTAHANLGEQTSIFRGRTTDELIPKIVSALGSDAIVLRHHKGLTGGFAGFFQRPFVEIEACRGGSQLLDRYDEDDASPVLPGQFDDPQPQEAPVAGDEAMPATGDVGMRAAGGERMPVGGDEAMQAAGDDWAVNPFAAALAEAEAAVRAAEPAVPPDLDAALAAALAAAEAAGLSADPTAPADHDAALAAALAEAEAEAEAAELRAEVEARAQAAELHPEAEASAEAAELHAEVEARAQATELHPEAEARTAAAELRADAAIPPDYDPSLANTTSFPALPASVEPHDCSPQTAAPVSRVRTEHALERASLERTLLEVGFDEQFVSETIDAAAAHVLPLIEAASSSALPSSAFLSSASPSSPASPTPSAEPASPSALARAVRRALQQRIHVCPPLPPGPATIALVGPGGSGKSACCTALLDAYHQRSTLPAACAAIVPGPDGELEVVFDRSRGTHASGSHPRFDQHFPESIRIDDLDTSQSLLDAREEGLLLLDTPPLSPADHISIGALAATLERLAPDRVVLALPATLGAKPAARLLEAYRPLGTCALAITHTDETDQLGVAVQVACALGLAPAYLLEGDGSGLKLNQIDPADLVDRLLAPR